MSILHAKESLWHDGAPGTCKLMVIRHGETVWNAAHRLQGHTDIALNANGIRQAELTGRWIVDQLRSGALSIDAVYSSDLSRAVDTAQPIAALANVEVRLDARLREMHLGVFQGLTVKEILAQFADEFDAYRRDHRYVIPGGESQDQKYLRTSAALEDIARRHVGQVVVIVCHGGVLDDFYRLAMRIPISQRKLPITRPNACISFFTYHAKGDARGRKWSLDEWAFVGHLAENDKTGTSSLLLDADDAAA